MELEKKIAEIMEKYIEEGIVAGANLLIEKEGKEICYCEAGLADREAGKPIQRDTIFRLYSQSKPVTAAAAMILMERGRLDLCQQVSRYLPVFAKVQVWDKEKNRAVPAARPMVVQDLLRMTSGLVYPDGGMTVPGLHTGMVFDRIIQAIEKGEPTMTTRETADALAACPLLFEPGEGFCYSSSADVLGAVIEAAADMKYSEFLKKEIFEPLGMEDTGFWVPQEKQHRLAKVYETMPQEDGSNRLVLYTGNNLGIRNDMAREPEFASGGAGLASTLDDYMRFGRMLLQEGTLDGVQILRPQTVRYMTGMQLAEDLQKAFNRRMLWQDGYSYGNLMRVGINPAQAGMLIREGEYGWDGWLGPYFINFPREKITLLMGMQKKDAGTFEMTRCLRNVILSSVL